MTMVTNMPQPGESSRASQDERQALREALRRPRGRYEARRAAQLSGVPERTVYDWAKKRVLVPDYVDQRPKEWSYRDLVYLGLTAWLRSKSMDLVDVVPRVTAWRLLFEDPTSATTTTEIHSDGRGLALGRMETDELTGQKAFDLMIDLTNAFDLLEPVDQDFLGTGRLWGPNLVRPSELTSMSPWVMSGEPCIRDTRIPTASLYVMHAERGLSSEDLSYLYPDAPVTAVDDAIELETRLRHAA